MRAAVVERLGAAVAQFRADYGVLAAKAAFEAGLSGPEVAAAKDAALSVWPLLFSTLEKYLPEETA